MLKSRLVLLLMSAASTLGANVLVLLPLPFTSHTLTFKPLFVELAQRGHNVTYIGSLALPETKNLRQTVVEMSSMGSLIEKLVAAARATDQWGFLSHFWFYGSQFVDTALDHPSLNALLHDDSQFDVIITEPYFLQEPLVVFGRKFNAPVVGIFPLSPTIWASYCSGNLMPFSYVPSYKTPYSDHMTFSERIQNTLLQLYEFIGTKYYYLPMQEEVVKRKMGFKGSEDLPTLEEIIKDDVALHLIDYHYSSGYSRPFENNILQVGGLTLARAKSEPLGKELSDLMEASKGVIYFSLGSHLAASSLGEEAIRELMTAFGQLKEYQILMKWDLETPPPGLPANVKTSKWFPQPTVLGHPKTKVMIGHGGLHGIMESIHHGVPFIGIPHFSDQESNTRFAAAKGFGLRVGREELTADNLLRAVTSLLNDPKFKENAVKRSLIARDRIMQPLDLAVYGVEYVIRHKGAAHLRPAALDVSWYQYLLVDVVAVIIVVPLVVIYIMYKASFVFRPVPPSARPKKVHPDK